MTGNGAGTVTIGFSELREVIEKALGTKIPQDAEVVFGGARMNDGGELEIGYAWDNADCHPSEWADGQPEWLKR